MHGLSWPGDRRISVKIATNHKKIVDTLEGRQTTPINSLNVKYDPINLWRKA
jgi:hypothetical protein